MSKTTLQLFFVFSTIFVITYYVTSESLAQTTPTPTQNVAPTLTPSSTPEKSSGVDQINKLKDRIASRVAQLKLVEKRGAIGKVSEVTNTQITLTDHSKNTRFIDVDELTKFSSPSANGSFGISDIKKGETIAVLGIYNKQSRRILARFINILEPLVSVSGKIKAVDSTNFTITITSESEEYTIDIENTTKTQLYTKQGGILRAGFSKLIEDQFVIARGEPKNEKNRISASRIVIFPELETLEQNATNSPTVTPVLGSQTTIAPSVIKKKQY